MITFKEFLTELIGVKKFQGKTRQDVEKFAKAEGKYKLLGSGYAGTAVEYNGFAYKFWSTDPPYEEFIKYVMQNQNNPLLPKIYSKKINKIPVKFLDKHEDHPDTVQWVKMELLSRGRVYFKVTDFGNALRMRDVMTIAKKSRKDAQGMGMTEREYIESELIWESYSQKDPKYGDKEADGDSLPGKLNKQGQLLPNTLVDLVEIANHHNLNIDDHHDFNFMLRDNFPVLIDPFFSDDSLDLNNKLLTYDLARVIPDAEPEKPQGPVNLARR